MKTLLRILISPIVFICYTVCIACLFVFPLGLAILFSLAFMVATPFIWVLRKLGADIGYPLCFSFVQRRKWFKNKNAFHIFIGHLITVTSPIWLPFATTWNYIKTGELITGN